VNRETIVRLREDHNKLLVRVNEKLDHIARLISPSEELGNLAEVAKDLSQIEKEILDHFKYEEKTIFSSI